MNSWRTSAATAGARAIKIEGEGELIYVEPEKGSDVGLRINPPGGHETIAEFSCSTKEQPNFVKAKLFGAVIGVQTGDINAVSKESSLTCSKRAHATATHVFGGTEYKPLVNIIGDAEEAGPAAACFASVPKSKAEEEAQSECQKEHPPHVIVGEYCGEIHRRPAPRRMHAADLHGPEHDRRTQGRSLGDTKPRQQTYSAHPRRVDEGCADIQGVGPIGSHAPSLFRARDQRQQPTPLNR